MRWQKKITKTELAHVKKWVGNTLAEFKEMVVIHEKARKANPNSNPCYICQNVSRKLGLIE